MGTLSARNLRESLQKARNVGIQEEPFTLFEDCELVVRNLRPDEYEAINAEVKELDGVDYLYAFQRGHVKRAVVEINGQDLRDTQFVEDEEPDPKREGQTKTVKLELADWLLKNVISTWSKEALYVVYRKVEDAVEQAEKKAKTGISFITPDETDEDRFRRLVGELKDMEDNLPAKLLEHVLDQAGYMRKSTAEEIKSAMDKATQLARDEEAKKRGESPPPQAVAAPHVSAPAAAPGPDPQDLLRNRQPMNQGTADVPQPIIVSPMPRNTVPARQPSAAPPILEQVHPPMQGMIPGPALHGSAAVRGARQAALENEADAAGALTAASPAPVRPQVPVLERKLAPADPKAAATVIDPKPRGGINPHFRSPNRL